MVNFEYTPRAASETAGLGFQLPLAQRQVGVDVRNADPAARRRAADASFYEPATDIDTTLTAMRDEYMLGVQELNELSRQAFAKGYDPRSVDYSDANSIEVNRRFMNKIADIKMKEAQLRQTKELKQRAFAGGQIFSSSYNAQQMIDNSISPSSFIAVQEYNKGVSATRIENRESYLEALKDRERVLGDLKSKLDANIARAQGDESMIAKLLDEHKSAIIGLQMPSFEGLSDKEKAEIQQRAKDLELRERKMIQDANFKRQEIEQKWAKLERGKKTTVTPEEYAESISLFEETYQTPFGTATTVAFAMPNISVSDELDGFFDISPTRQKESSRVSTRKAKGNATFGRVMMLPIDAAGNPLPQGAGEGDWKGEFAPFAVGTLPKKRGFFQVAYPVDRIYDRIAVKGRREGIRAKVAELDPIAPKPAPLATEQAQSFDINDPI